MSTSVKGRVRTGGDLLTASAVDNKRVTSEDEKVGSSQGWDN